MQTAEVVTTEVEPTANGTAVEDAQPEADSEMADAETGKQADALPAATPAAAVAPG